MLKVDFKTKRVFGFTPPNLCLLGNENDFHELAQAIVVLTGQNDVEINLLDLPFVSRAGEDKTIIFSSKEGSKLLGCFDDKNQLVFALDKRYWDRLFVFFVLESWKKRTDYLNENETALSDLNLEQQCNFICSSEF